MERGVAAGLEGSGLTAFVQYPELSGLFELRCLSIPNGDRSTFQDLVALVRQQLRVSALMGREPPRKPSPP
jgi:hypothetical protein